VPLAQALAKFQNRAAQSDNLIVNAHKVDASSKAAILPVIDQQQITVAAFLNLFIAWETFIEVTLHELMTRSATLSGKKPTRYVCPVSQEAARTLVVGPRGTYFDYGNHNLVKPLVKMYFLNGYPYEPFFSSVEQDLADIRTKRNAAAHITSTTQTALEGLAARILRKPAVGINLYDLLMAKDPGSPSGATVFVTYRDRLLVTAELMVKG